jgi:hypothetical protein
MRWAVITGPNRRYRLGFLGADLEWDPGHEAYRFPGCSKAMSGMKNMPPRSGVQA